MSANPPGSTFKPLGAIAGLESGNITQSSVISCPGGLLYGGRFFKCHGGAHGALTVEHAIEKSCNTFFYSLILRMGLDTWSDYAHRMGFGKKTGLDIGEEKPGICPSTAYYNRVYGPNRWTKGYTVSLGIGQGELSVTPLQLAQYTALIANNGRTKKPHLVKGMLDSHRKFIPYKFDEVNAGISQKTLDLVKHGMYLVVNGAGTAGIARLPDYAVAGKTGTAQNPHGKDHAWFIAFAPYENPKIAVACFVENAGFGATNAAPIVRDVIKTYLDKMKNPKGYKLEDVISNQQKDK
jgi:penicillin-binding protein 2